MFWPRIHDECRILIDEVTAPNLNVFMCYRRILEKKIKCLLKAPNKLISKLERTHKISLLYTNDICCHLLTFLIATLLEWFSMVE